MYNNISELPASTRVLPIEGKRIYMKFFNRAYEKYRSDATAAQIAWQAVKRKYIKVNGEWVPRSDANEYDTTTTDDDDTTTTDTDTDTE
ncbi:Unknown (Ac60) [Spodoptera exigua multiple nucleopolyhedrovirus]|nr:Unknown (Ac60) [Spodoptera exigua multiple nucleopolyhedrovirus]CDG72577.1 Unknown (Ac60) [Spodoptera exigua multiple nucleopolyhedrovirus]CDG72714.1 Unknown (Ac60) [Spodoptera exigua multiple nucleopolyhedrovirus]CDG72851.1 Unknown (Ac60) [Spodoptera exigua multiple nucleopolyhedrovirus]CDG73003.1 Unknown (Ac60) [Spodoptera exigua multiple nucleopolyhedrovirus]